MSSFFMFTTYFLFVPGRQMLLLCFIGSYKSECASLLAFDLFLMANSMSDKQTNAVSRFCPLEKSNVTYLHRSASIYFSGIFFFFGFELFDQKLSEYIYIYIVLSQHSQVFLYSFNLYVSKLFCVCEFHVCLIK